MIAFVVNAGSSSLKASLYDVCAANAAAAGAAPPPALWEGSRTLTSVPGGGGDLLALMWRDASHAIGGPESVNVVGHRVVYGGPTLTASVRITPLIRETIARAAQDAPSHNALELLGIDAAARLFGGATPQVAVFDTAFHITLPPRAYTYAGPYEWLSLGLRRNGFHGVSHQYASHRAARMLGHDGPRLRVVTAHLGSGCSLAAVHDGRSVDTTMGFTPTDGVPMATRSGAVDPGLLMHVLRHGMYTASALEHTLNQDSGLKGLSGVSGDVRAVIGAADAGNPRAQLAIAVFVHRLQQSAAAMAASMNGLDAMVFTGGVGEHSSRIRAEVCEGLGFLGVALDAGANSVDEGPDRVISARGSPVSVLVVQAAENWMIAQEAVRLASAG